MLKNHLQNNLKEIYELNLLHRFKLNPLKFSMVYLLINHLLHLTKKCIQRRNVKGFFFGQEGSQSTPKYFKRSYNRQLRFQMCKTLSD